MQGALSVCLLQAATQAELERLTTQMQDAIVAAEVGKAKVLMYDELSARAEKLVSSYFTGVDATYR